MDTLTESVYKLDGVVQEVISKYWKQAQKMDLSGIGHFHSYSDPIQCGSEECCGTDPLEWLKTQLNAQLVTVIQSQTHTHEWDENYFCVHCNWDGNA